MLKLLGIILIGICAAFAAIKTAESGRKRLEIYESLISFVMELRNGITCFRLPLCELYSRCKLTALTSRGFTGMLTRLGWQDSLKMSGIADMLDERSLAALCELGSVLGKSDTAEQESACAYCISRLQENYEKIRTESPRKTRMESSLCLLGGIAIIIVLV